MGQINEACGLQVWQACFKDPLPAMGWILHDSCQSLVDTCREKSSPWPLLILEACPLLALPSSRLCSHHSLILFNNVLFYIIWVWLPPLLYHVFMYVHVHCPIFLIGLKKKLWVISKPPGGIPEFCPFTSFCLYLGKMFLDFSSEYDYL